MKMKMTIFYNKNLTKMHATYIARLHGNLHGELEIEIFIILLSHFAIA